LVRQQLITTGLTRFPPRWTLPRITYWGCINFVAANAYGGRLPQWGGYNVDYTKQGALVSRRGPETATARAGTARRTTVNPRT